MLLSSLGLRLHKPQLFRSKRPVNRALGFCHSLGFDGSSAPYGNACVERDRPFPHMPSNALNDAILNAAILHVVKNRSGVFASGMSILFRDPTNSSPRVPKENGPSRGRTEAALIQTPDGWGYRGERAHRGLPPALEYPNAGQFNSPARKRFPQQWPIFECVNGPKKRPQPGDQG
jgi:hypothetical protein